MKQTIAIMLIAASLSGCATATPVSSRSTPVSSESTPASSESTTTPLAVGAADRERYWTPVSNNVAGGLPGNPSPATLSTQVMVDYTIDTDGRVRDAVATRFSPEGSNPDWALQMIRTNRFKPGPDNPQRQAIRTSTEVTLGPASRR